MRGLHSLLGVVLMFVGLPLRPCAAQSPVQDVRPVTEPWRHRDSGLTFAGQVAGFERIKAETQGPADYGASVTYRSRLPIGVLVSVSPIRPTEDAVVYKLSEEFRAHTQRILRTYPGAKMVKEDSTGTVFSRESRLACNAWFRWPSKGNGAPVEARLSLRPSGNHWVACLFAYPAGQSQAAGAECEQFLKDLQPDRG